MSNNLNPRAKIGDVVMLPPDKGSREYKEERLSSTRTECTKVTGASCIEGKWRYTGNWTHGMYFFEDEDILKNLTTNVSYE